MSSVRTLIATTIVAFLASSAQALTLPKISVPKGLGDRTAAFGSRASPKVRAFVAREGAAQAMSKAPSVGAVKADVQRAGFGRLNEADIDALCFVVMAQAADDQLRDLKTIMNALKATHGRGPVPAQTNTTGYTVPGFGGPTTVQEIKDIQQELKSKLDSQSELGEMASLRLQMAMDRESKLMDTLSNLMKSLDNTDEAILQNIK